MIDSSGRSGIRTNGTVLDLLPVSQIIGILGLLMVVLFTLVKPEASNGLDFKARILFWTLHVGMGLASLWIASRWLASGKHLPNGTLISVLLTGFAGALLATPGYLALDAVYSSYIVDLDPDPDPEDLRLPLKLLEEIFELAPWFLAAWVLINLPVLLPAPASSIRLNDVVVAIDEEVEAPSPEPAKQQFLLSLPGVIGTDVIAVASDLHYLNVWTVAGRTTVLGRLRDVVEELDDLGMQVHRSHWIAHTHVRRVVGNASDAACIMSNELRVPISRRRWKSVREQFGRGVIHGADQNKEETAS